MIHPLLGRITPMHGAPLVNFFPTDLDRNGSPVRGWQVWETLAVRGYVHLKRIPGIGRLFDDETYESPQIFIIPVGSICEDYLKWLRRPIGDRTSVDIIDFTTDTLDPMEMGWLEEGGDGRMIVPPTQAFNATWGDLAKEAISLADGVMCSYAKGVELAAELNPRSFYVPDAIDTFSARAYLHGLNRTLDAARQHYHENYVRPSTGKPHDEETQKTAAGVRKAQFDLWESCIDDLEMHQELP